MSNLVFHSTWKKIHPLLKNISGSHKEIGQQVVEKENILVMARQSSWDP